MRFAQADAGGQRLFESGAPSQVFELLPHTYVEPHELPTLPVRHPILCMRACTRCPLLGPIPLVGTASGGHCLWLALLFSAGTRPRCDAAVFSRRAKEKHPYIRTCAQSVHAALWHRPVLEHAFEPCANSCGPRPVWPGWSNPFQ